MEAWLPLFDIFLNSPTPESEASLWLDHSFDASSTPSITTNSFIALVAGSTDAIVTDSTSSPSSCPPSPRSSQRVMWIETLPSMVQARILSFLAYEHRRFCSHELGRLARSVLDGDRSVDFWVKRAAHNLLDKVSESDHGLNHHFGVSSGGSKSVEDEFYELPSWLKDARVDGAGDDLVLPWLPLSIDDGLRSAMAPVSACMEDKAADVDAAHADDEGVEDEVMVDSNEVQEGHEDGSISPDLDESLGPEIPANVAASITARLLNFESASTAVGIANEIRQLCIMRKGDALGILGLFEPWKAEDEAVAILLSHMVLVGDNEEEEDGWPSQVLCTTVLPKLLVLEEPASRVLVSATMEYCKLHQRAAEYALLLPLILKKDGINNPICDVVSRIIRESLHPAHVASFCQKLLCGEEDARKKMACLPCHRALLSSAELVWTEPLFSLFQNILNHNVHLTQDSVDHLVRKVEQLAKGFSKSLKFGYFLLCLVTKCAPMLKSHALQLMEAANLTNTLVTKSVLTKLASLSFSFSTE
ncbi:hypothetical protein Dimus_027254 [Dionaea muscipula]